jgi:uncharacterized protein (DUF2132 family)
MAMHGAKVIAKDEELRRQKLRALLLRDEKAVLQDQLVQKDTKIDSLMTKCQELEEELRQTRAMARKQETQMKGQARDICMLQVRVASSASF